jgi:hypothetical protein
MEVDDDPVLQRRESLLQRIAWPLLYALLLAIALGLLGDGPLSRTTVSAQEGVTLDYPRFARRQAEQTLELSVMATSPRVVLQVDNRWLQQVNLEQVVPQPAEVRADGDGTRLVFHATPGAVLQVQLRLKPSHPGRLPGRFSVDAGPPLAFSQFVYP